MFLRLLFFHLFLLFPFAQSRETPVSEGWVENSMQKLCLQYRTKININRNSCKSGMVNLCPILVEKFQPNGIGIGSIFASMCYGRGYRPRRTTTPIPRSMIRPAPCGSKHGIPCSFKTIAQNNCRRKRGGCKRQSVADRKKKAQQLNYKTEEFQSEGLSASQAKRKARVLQQKNQEAKKAIFAAQGLADIAEPKDDGLWQGDMSLNREQLDIVIREVQDLETVGDIPEPDSAFASLVAPPARTSKSRRGHRGRRTRSRRNKRFSMYFEGVPFQKWQLPITYIIEAGVFSGTQADLIRSGLRDIESKTCIRFKEVKTQPAKPQHFILYRRYFDPSFCGQSPLGDQGRINMIWLNFECKSIAGSIIHETLHSLGVQHQHVRVDRDEWLQLNWNNIDPQHWELLDGRSYVKTYSSYGVDYDYYSIMHYKGSIGAINPDKPVLVAKKFNDHFQKVMGQRKELSDKDAEILRKMYCLPEECVDQHVFCGFYAMPSKGYCLNDRYFIYMKEVCSRSCGFCPIQGNNP